MNSSDGFTVIERVNFFNDPPPFVGTRFYVDWGFDTEPRVVEWLNEHCGEAGWYSDQEVRCYLDPDGVDRGSHDDLPFVEIQDSGVAVVFALKWL